MEIFPSMHILSDHRSTGLELACMGTASWFAPSWRYYIPIKGDDGKISFLHWWSMYVCYLVKPSNHHSRFTSQSLIHFY